MSKILDPEKFAAVLAEESATLPAPARCEKHSNCVANAPTCDSCRQYRNWAARMKRRFALRGFSFRPGVPHPDAPPECRDGHTNPRPHYSTCADCRSIDNWRKRDAERRVRETGRPLTFSDIPLLAGHVKALEKAGMPAVEIAERVGVDDRVIRNLTNRPPLWVKASTAEALLALPLPKKSRILIPDAYGRVRRRVNSVGTMRRIQAAAINGHSLTEQAAMLGWSRSTMRRWRIGGEGRNPSVSIDAADDVAMLYPKLMATPGTNVHAAGTARSKGWMPGRYFDESNIDNPKYKPLAMVKNPRGLRRQLQALAWLAHGPEQISQEIGEPAEKIREWMLGGSAPAYVRHLLVPVYERWSFTQGPDQEVADLARRHGWAPPLAWDDLDIDSPFVHPCRDLPKRSPGKTKHVLSSAVFDAIDGKIPAADLLHEEKIQVVRALHRRGWSDRRIAAWLRWHEDLDKGQANVAKFREREEITGFGIPMHGLANADEDLILWGAAS